MSDYPDLKIGHIKDLKSIIALEAFWRDTRFAYSDGKLLYKGVNYFHDAATDSDTWEIWKYTWGDDGPTRIEGPLPGSWDGRAALSWG